MLIIRLFYLANDLLKAMLEKDP